MVNALYIQHDSVVCGSKGVDFVFHILGDHPRFTAIEKYSDTSSIKELDFCCNGYVWTLPELFQHFIYVGSNYSILEMT